MAAGVRVGLIADDLTGACDSSLPFLAGGRVQVGLWPHVPQGDLVCAAVSTESRELPPELAFERSRQAARQLRGEGRLIYRKVDSRLQGNLAADIAGVLADWGGTCLLAPALPAEGRITRQGVQSWPGGEVVIAGLLGGIADRVTVRDAESDAGLAAAAAEVAAAARLLPAGSAGLAAQLPAALGITARDPSQLPSCRNPLALVGSPAAFAQAAHAARLGWAVERRVRGDIVDLDAHDSLFLTGGGTAAGVLGQLAAAGLELVGEATPRVAVGVLLGGHCPGLPVALRSGSFGHEEAMAEALAALTAIG